MATIDTVKEVLVENLDLEADKITEEEERVFAEALSKVKAFFDAQA